MLKGVFRVLVLLLFGLMVSPAAFAGGPLSSNGAKNKDKKAVSASAKNTKSAKAQAQTKKRMSPEQLRAEREGVGENIGEWVPMPGTDGTPGLFMMDTGLTLPKGAFDATGFGYKYGLAPGSLNLLDVGWTVGVGLTNRLTVFVGWDAYRHIHLGLPGELSLNAMPDKPYYPGTIYHIPFQPMSNRPSYNESYPFAYENNGGIGPVRLGAKFGILSEARGNPISLSVRDVAYFATKHGLKGLMNNAGVQTGAFSDLIGVTASKTFANAVTWSFDYGHLFTRDPRDGGQHLLTLADQEQLSTGFAFLPNSRIQPMTEYHAIVYDGAATPTMTFGPRDPIMGIWGARIYPWHVVSVDVGYLYMLNMPQVRDRNGFIFKINAEYWPGKAIPADDVTVSSTAHPDSVQQGSGQRVSLTAHGTDSLGHTLTYTWTAPAGQIRGTGPNVEWDPAGADPGKYTLSVRAEDPYGNFATSSQHVTVTPKPIPPPTMACTSARPSILPGERVGITASVKDESGTGLTYTWRTTGGKIIGSGPSVVFDSTGLAPGTYTVTGRVENAKGQASDCQAQVTVQAPPPPKPQASKINQCLFRTYSTRVNNVCKRILDNVALRLQNETGAHVVVIGYASSGKSARSKRLAERRAARRAENVKKYLVSKGVSGDRIQTRTGTATAGASVKENNRIEIIWVPEGATY
jgi:outer membrane protein OmpA-like peptidoglycan-associated protein